MKIPQRPGGTRVRRAGAELTARPVAGRIERAKRDPDGRASMVPTKELADAIYRERVLRARRTPMEQKILAGPQLYDMVCRLMKDGIRNQFPDADERRVEEIFRQRLAIARRLEE